MKDVVYLTDENYESEQWARRFPSLLTFMPTGAARARWWVPIIEDLAEKYAGKAKICKINIDEQRKLAITNKVMSIPTIFFIKDGEIKERISGALPQSVLERS
jgi:thioredoxin 1